MTIDTTCSSRDVISSFDVKLMMITILMMLDLKWRNENLRAEYSLNHTSGNEFGAINSFLKDFHQQQQSHAMRSGLLSSKSQSLGQMVVKKAIGMDDDVFKDQDDSEGG